MQIYLLALFCADAHNEDFQLPFQAHFRASLPMVTQSRAGAESYTRYRQEPVQMHDWLVRRSLG